MKRFTAILGLGILMGSLLNVQGTVLPRAQGSGTGTPAACADSTTAYRKKDMTIVTGCIRERTSGAPMKDVNIFIQGTTECTGSDETGNFSIRSPLHAVLTVSHVGYLTERMPVGLGGSLDILLRRGIYQIPLPEVTGGYYASTPPAPTPRRYVRSKDGGYTVLEQMPNFIYGGYAGLALYLNEKAAEAAERSGLKGKVNIGFTVRKDATVSDLYIIQTEDPLLNRSATEIVRGIEGWIPGKQRRNPVDVRVSMVIRFDRP